MCVLTIRKKNSSISHSELGLVLPLALGGLPVQGVLALYVPLPLFECGGPFAFPHSWCLLGSCHAGI